MIKNSNLPKAKILLVDDRSENILVLKKILAAPDREIFTAESGVDGLKLALNNDFAIILSDVMMPGMNGFQMLEILRMDDKNKMIPVIFVTAIGKDEKYIHRGYSEGAVDYLFKPLNVDIVKSKVDIFVSLFHQNAQLKQQAEQLKNLNEEKNKFLGMAAHDLRNPIGIIQHLSNFLLEDVSDKISEEDIKFVEQIKMSSKLMQDLVDELLDISKIESGKFQVELGQTDVNALVQNAVMMNRIFANRKHISIEIQEKIDIPPVMMDSMKMNLVMNNLIGNAIKYSPSKSTTTVSYNYSGDNLVISVKDEGPGIPEEEIEGLFEAFSTTQNETTGGESSTGLGLMIVSKIVEAHQGTIEVKSDIGQGTEFIITIPIQQIENAQLPIMTSKQINGKQFNALYVDDSYLIREISKRLFKPFEAINMTFAEDGEEAMNMLQNGIVPDIVFTDINMPKMDGYVLTKTLREKYPNGKPVIIGMTAYLDDEIKEKVFKIGMNECLEKPLSSQDFQSILSKYNFIENNN